MVDAAPNQIAAVEPKSGVTATPTCAAAHVAYTSAPVTPGGSRSMYGALTLGHRAACPSTIPTSWPAAMPRIAAPRWPGGVRSTKLAALPDHTAAWYCPGAPT